MTQKRLAELAGTSVVTVYNAIHRKELVKPETREKILELMREYDYHTDFIARAMVKGRTNVIGVIVPNFEVVYYAKVISAVERQLREAGYHCILAQHHDDPVLEREEMDMMREYRVDGVIIRNCGRDIDNDQINNLAKAGVPFVLMDGHCKGHEKHFVGFDDFTGSLNAVEYLLRLGHHRIGVVGFHRSGDLRNSVRYKGYEQALKSHGLSPTPAWVRNCATEYFSGKEEVVSIRKNDGGAFPTAFFTFNDHTAIGVLKGLSELNVNAEVVGFGAYWDEILMPENFFSVEQDFKLLAGECVKMLLSQIENQEAFGPLLVPCGKLISTLRMRTKKG